MTQNPVYDAISNEFKKCQQDEDLPKIGCVFKLKDNDMYQWKVTMCCPKETPYENGIFTILILFPPDYPRYGPEFRFMNKIYNLNVDSRGDWRIYHSNLNEYRYSGKVRAVPNYGIKQALFDIYSTFYFQPVNSAFNYIWAEQYKNNRAEFEKEAKKWTQEYATKPL